ncbi:MAG: alpha/beta hydrolase [Gemmatimonadota bacterium]
MIAFIRTAAFVLVAAYGVALVVAFFFSDRMILPAPSSTYERRDPDMVTLRAIDGSALVGLHLPLEGARYAILYSHGNFEDIGLIRPRMEMLRELGFEVFGYDYRGYGLSEGTASVRAASEDARVAYTYLRDELGVPPTRVVLYGRSVGGGPTLQLAAAEPVAGVILEGAFTTAFRVVTQVPVLPFDRFPNETLIDRVDAPVLIVHGRRDRVVPFRHGPALFQAAREPKRHSWFDRAGHNDIPETAWEQYAAAVRAFAVDLQAAEPGGPDPGAEEP